MPHLQFANRAQRSVWEDLHQLNITVRRCCHDDNDDNDEDDDDDDDDGGDDHNEESDEDDDLTSGRNSLQHPDRKSATSLERCQHLSIIGISIYKYNDHCHHCHIDIVGSTSSTL